MQPFEIIFILKRSYSQYKYFMKKKYLPLLIPFALLCAFLLFFTGCNKSVNYLSYVSEKRTNIYLYEDDNVSIKIHCVSREYPYNADGVCGQINDLIEVFVTLPKTYNEVEVSLSAGEGEMNYQAVESRYYLSFTAKELTGDSVDVTLTYDGESKTYSALSVKYAGVMSCDDAVKCVIEHDKTLFENLTQNGLFDGEISVRLLYDEGCYYYVGVCDKTKHITAYLIDGERGIVIATKDIQG